MLKVINVVGARPNFMKVAPIVEAMKRREAEFAPLVVHTGQHYDAQMSDAFFRDLGLPEPDVYLNVGSGSHAVQTAASSSGSSLSSSKRNPIGCWSSEMSIQRLPVRSVARS